MTDQTEQTRFAGYLSYEEQTGRCWVRSIDVCHAGVLHKLTYPGLTVLDRVFVPPLVEALEARLEALDWQGEMLSEPDFVLALPGAVFRKLRLHASFHAARGYQASFWFSSLEGQPLAALQHFADLPMAEKRHEIDMLAVDTIDRILIPALNLVSSLRGGGLANRPDLKIFDTYTARLMQEADDLILYAELVKRTVHEKEAGRVIAADDLTRLRQKRLGSVG